MKIISSYKGRIKRVLLLDILPELNTVPEVIERNRLLFEGIGKHTYSDKIIFEIVSSKDHDVGPIQKAAHQFSLEVGKIRQGQALAMTGLGKAMYADDPFENLYSQLQGQVVQWNLQRRYASMEEKAMYYKEEIQQIVGEKEVEVEVIEPDFDGKYFLEEILFLMTGIRFDQLPDPSNFQKFPQDPFVVLQNESGRPTLLKPYYAWAAVRKGTGGQSTFNPQMLFSKFLSEMLSAHRGYLTISTPLLFQGGNMLAGDDFVIVGSDVIKKNCCQSQEFTRNPKSLLERLKLDLGVKNIISYNVDFNHFKDPTPQPDLLFHLDLFLTLAGKDEREPSRNIAIVGEHWQFVDGTMVKVEKGEVYDYLKAFAAFLETYHRNGIQFKVLRMPLVQIGFKTFSYNNSIVEVYYDEHAEKEVKKVFFPAFGTLFSTEGDERLTRFDKKVRKFWRKLGFKPYPVDFHFANMAGQQASLHCLAQVVERA